MDGASRVCCSPPACDWVPNMPQIGTSPWPEGLAPLYKGHERSRRCLLLLKI